MHVKHMFYACVLHSARTRTYIYTRHIHMRTNQTCSITCPSLLLFQPACSPHIETTILHICTAFTFLIDHTCTHVYMRMRTSHSQAQILLFAHCTRSSANCNQSKHSTHETHIVHTHTHYTPQTLCMCASITTLVLSLIYKPFPAPSRRPA